MKKTVRVKRMKNGEYGHQGDVILTKVDALPKNAQPKEGTTVAYGEVTGHHHTFTNGQLFQVPTGDQYVVLDEPATLTHQEHADQVIQKGIYKVEIQREFDLVEGVRQVLD